MAEKQIEQLVGLLDSQLARLERYGRLIQKQEKLIEQEDYEPLGRVLERKAKILSSMQEVGSLASLAASPAKEEGGEAERADKLLAGLINSLNLFVKQEKECLDKALGVRENIAGQLYALRKGKKLLREYTRASKDIKARFKDIKT
ncbi:MAG TPA: hypothetical protein VM123_13185 [archaeon]|nr:hypothetical protein [archaeon]